MSIFLSFTSLFWYKLVFMGELLISEVLFTWKLKRKNRFALRLLCCAAGIFVVTFFFPIFVHESPAYTSAMFLALFAVTIAAMKLCFAEPWVNILFCALAAYTTQHLAYEVYNFTLAVTGLNNGMSMGFYGEQPLGEYNGFTALAYGDSYVIVYWLMYLLFGTRISRNSDLHINNYYLLLLSALIVLVDIVLSIFTTYTSGTDYNLSYIIITGIYNFICCLLAMAIQFGMLSRRKLEKELDTVHRLWLEDKEHYELAKRNIDIINVKCHDLKHQIRGAARGGTLDESALMEIEKAVDIYGSVVKTGNEALDVILTEKSLYCEEHGIRLTCMADGAQLSFMSSGDIYSLFGNAVDNAVEYVSRLDSDDKKLIRLSVRCADRLLSVHIENYYEGGSPKMRDGLPVTTKEDKIYHGFGMMSMRIIAEKYGGNMFVSAEGSLFIVDFVFPINV